MGMTYRLQDNRSLDRTDDGFHRTLKKECIPDNLPSALQIESKQKLSFHPETSTVANSPSVE